MHPIVVFIYLLLLLVSNALCYKSNTAIIQATPSDRDENAAGNIPIAELTLNDIAKILERSGETTHPQGFVGQQSRIIDDGPPSSNVRNFVVPRWIKLSNQPQRNKRSLRPLSSSSPLGGGLLADELRAYIASATNELGGSNELVLSDELMNAPLSQLNGDLAEHSSLMKLILKRNLDFNPRLGRRSVGGDDCNEFQQHGSPRCLGKKDMQYTPRLGRRSG